MFKHLLVPVDLDAPDVADKAIEVARHIARRDGAGITLVSVHQVVVDPGVYRGVEDDPRMLDYLRSKTGDVAMKGIVVSGDSVSRAIRGAAVEHGADLIVMASHEPNLSDYLIGSNAAHVALHAECSVLVVR